MRAHAEALTTPTKCTVRSELRRKEFSATPSQLRTCGYRELYRTGCEGRSSLVVLGVGSDLVNVRHCDDTTG